MERERDRSERIERKEREGLRERDKRGRYTDRGGMRKGILLGLERGGGEREKRGGKEREKRRILQGLKTEREAGEMGRQKKRGGRGTERG